ncbi:hypothetical protein BV25DRAFT_1825034 [Artomyces pyxidatus]|uniref:Uncharacterized protein n=1 Tax=Artomyces pyxidatus TaxID=48021 RepID=A0ACB8T3D5_9AGAM|nr:hypothetical protein BV25DRAFT_1825034 [Artomyces pyxidatus]
MSALDLHNTLFSPEPSYSPHTPSDSRISHTRTISAITVATSSHSHPTEPLLHPSSPSSAAYRDILSRQPAHPDSPRAEWDSSLDGDRVTSIEQRGYWEQSMRRRLRRLRTIKGVLLLLIGECAMTSSRGQPDDGICRCMGCVHFRPLLRRIRRVFDSRPPGCLAVPRHLLPPLTHADHLPRITSAMSPPLYPP